MATSSQEPTPVAEHPAMVEYRARVAWHVAESERDRALKVANAARVAAEVARGVWNRAIEAARAAALKEAADSPRWESTAGWATFKMHPREPQGPAPK